MNRLFANTILLLTIAVISAFTVNYLSPAGIALVGQWDTSQGVITAKAKNENYEPGLEIEDLEVAKQIYDQGGTVFLDARTEDVYLEGHVKGALSFPVVEFDIKMEVFFTQYPLDQSFVAYCSGRTCEDSHQLAQMLIDFGYEKVSVMIDGFPGWAEKGYPVE